MEKKMCKNCRYAAEFRFSFAKSNNKCCVRRSDPDKGKVLLVADSYCCRGWKSAVSALDGICRFIKETGRRYEY